MTKHIHLIGIGGIGVSALAQAYLQMGYTVSGSDPSPSEHLELLEHKGIQVFYDHKKENLPENTDLVIYSEAIPEKNPELEEAKSKSIRTLTYFEGVGEISKDTYTIAVAGTHGKTTTTAMAALSLIHGELDPTVIVGSKLKEFQNTNFRPGKSNYFVVEACEYRESFLSLYPNMVLLTNCDVDHLDYYKDEEHYHNAYIKFIQKIPQDGVIFYHKDDKESEYVASHANCETIPVPNDIDLPKLNIPGEHNIQNAQLVYSAGEYLKINQDLLNKGITSFQGTWRRFEKIGEKDGIVLYDDYAHHPIEIQATLKTAKETFPNKRIISIFQPHQYSRTYKLLEDFKTSFSDADIVMIPNIYEARDTEEDKQSINAEIFCNELKKNHPHIQYTKDFNATVQALKEITKENDMVITMGAGDVWEIGRDFLV